MAAAYATTALALLLYSTVSQGWQVRTFFPFFAVGLGGSIPVRPAFQAEFFGLSPFGDPGTRLHHRNARQAGQPGLCRLALRHDRQLPPRVCHLVRGLAAGGPSGPVCAQACGVDYPSWLYWPTRRGVDLSRTINRLLKRRLFRCAGPA